MHIKKIPFGTLSDGMEVPLYTLVNDNGASVDITPYGGIVVRLRVPDREGNLGDVVLGFDTLEEYLDHNPFFGCLVGRYANRIANGRFTLNGVTYGLPENDGPNTLHGGVRGFDKKLWQAAARETAAGPALALGLLSPDGEEGFPGNLSLSVVYTLTDDDALRIDYTAVTDAPTVVNLTNHSYFNLSAGEMPTILDHVLMLNADAFTPADETLIPTGEVRPVEGTPMDFREPRRIGARIDADDEQLALGGGYDHNWVINGEPGELRLAARAKEPTSGRVMEVHTTEPGVQVYTGNALPAGLPGKDDQVYGPRAGLCLETQHFPDSPNKPAFPSTELAPGETFQSATLYAFSTE